MKVDFKNRRKVVVLEGYELGFSWADSDSGLERNHCVSADKSLAPIVFSIFIGIVLIWIVSEIGLTWHRVLLCAIALLEFLLMSLLCQVN